ncbi:hypothetical protein AOXY_G1382 [Acipenser oxyrinchus oxyrinchus]|uniref:Ectopic P granules protein 5 homolog n=1 Tax=Acipenser oxyrinchus oxyrinchus TaxID=40147 RepID=A0AAD8GKW8_ACIOX|nr:hypothetical protein AOXY_G1382 [Acipenser oxyrinchus oxyrinchus]
MAEAVRPKKSKTKPSGRSQDKKKKLNDDLKSVGNLTASSDIQQPLPGHLNETEGPPLLALVDRAQPQPQPDHKQAGEGLEFTDIPLSEPASEDAAELPVAELSLNTGTGQEEPDTGEETVTKNGEAGTCCAGELDTGQQEHRGPQIGQACSDSGQAALPDVKQTEHRAPESAFETSSAPLMVSPIPLHFVAAQLFATESQHSDSNVIVGSDFVAGMLSDVTGGSTSECRAPAVLPLVEQESPPSLVPVELVKPEKTYQRLYPELSCISPSTLPFTREQLRLWEPGSWLGNVELHVSEFEGMAHQEGHELHELLMQYWRCRKQLCQAQAELQAAVSDCKSTQNRLWSFRDEQLTLQGVCADQSKVCGYHRYQQVVLNKPVVGELQRLFESKAELLHQTLALHSYTALLSRLQVESYLYRLLCSTPAARALSVQDPPRAESPDLDSQPSSLQPLKDSISVLFSFTRRLLDDAQFQGDIHLWLQQLVSVLHGVGSVGDHLYLLNHILRCPAGVGKWAVPFLQIKVLDNPSGVYHFMQALAILVSPVRTRVCYLCHMKPSEKKSNSSGKESGNWTLVDEGGEEDEDPETSWLLLSEEDLVALFSQFPFDELFKHLLGINLKGAYQPQATTSQKMMTIFAFATSLVELLAIGLETYNRSRYRQFVKRIGHMIRMTLCYVSDHWAQYISITGTPMQEQESFSREKLQVEFDELFLRAVLHVLKAKRLGIWLFMSEMPYGTLSSAMLWKIFYIMQCTESEGLDRLSANLSPDDCVSRLKDPEHQGKFERWLVEINSSDGICLLTTFAHMAQPKRADGDPEFVRTIVLEIYEVSYVSVSTRETFSKVGRELLAAIATAHPRIISVLLWRLQETIDRGGMVSLYLFKELPLHLWRPAAAEIAVIRDWLLSHSLPAVENKLACIILEGLNWGSCGQSGALFLDPSLHTEVALLVAEAYQKYLTDKPYGGIISESIKQVSYLASVVRLGQTPESSFNQWAWDLVLRLKLHSNDRCPQDAWSPAPSTITPVPEISETPTLHPVLKAVKAGIPIGCYLAIAMTTTGHSLERLCCDGVALLNMLVQSRYLRAVVHVLQVVLPLVYPCQYYLLKNEQFLNSIQLFLQLDSGTPQGMAQQVTHKVTQHLTGASYGENVKLLNSVIQAHVSESSQPGRVGPAAVLEFWVQVLTGQNLWHRDRTVLYLLDHLCRAAFLHQQEESLQKLLYQQHKNALGYHGDKGLLSSLVGWIIAGNVTPSFIEGNSLPGEVWFSWVVLNMESIFEEDSQLRRCVEHELLTSPSLPPDQALKKAQARLKLPVVPSLQRLMVYRWAHQALVTPADHPLLPLVWQKFFLLYLRQPGPEFGLEARGCIGRRYFHSPAHSNLLKEMRQRLVEVADFHHAASKALKVPRDCEPGEGEGSSRSPTPEHMTSPEVHKELVRLINVFAVWLGDENLQMQEVYLPSLPKQYDSHRLAKVMQNQQELWMEYMDIEQVQHELREVLSLWTKIRTEPSCLHNSSVTIFTDFTNPQAARDRILTNLQKHDAPQAPVPLVSMRAPVPNISSSALSDETSAAKLIHDDLSALQHHAKLAALRESQQVALDSELLDTLPQLYSNREEQLSMQLECRGSGGRPCQGSALINVKFEGMHKHEAVLNQIQSLKRDIKQLQTDAMKPPPQSVAEAAVHVENFITALVNAYKLQTTALSQKIGITAFYQVVSFVCDDTQRHPPTRQFFSSCIEILGQVFIRDTQRECKQMLTTILHNRRLCNLLSPYFTPNASPRELVPLYEEVVLALHRDSGDVIFMLLTKFDLVFWLSSSQPHFSERSRLMELVHLALTSCGLQPDDEILMPFNLFCKHWTQLLCYQFPDHYSDFLRLLMQSSAEQLISPDCWRASLRALGCTSPPKKKSTKIPSSARETTAVSLSSQQIQETIGWLSDFFLKLHLSKADFRSFGLFSKWGPYMDEVKMFWGYLLKNVIDLEFAGLAKEPVGSVQIIKVLQALHSKIVGFFRPWILVLDTGEASSPRCYPWLETDTSAAASMVTLYSEFIDMLHGKFKEKLLPGQRGALWLHLMHYCETCTAPKMPEYILYTYHRAYSRLPWRDLHPDQALMDQFFKVERGSPKSCFLFMGTLLCQVNWVSVLSDALSPQPQPHSQAMVVYLLYMMVFLAKEDELISKPESPLLNLLGQASSLPWHFVDFTSYQNVLGYVNSHYPPALILKRDSSSELTVKLLKMAAGIGADCEGRLHQDMTPKCRAFIHLVVQFLVSLDQSGSIALAELQRKMERLLEDIVIFNPPETDLQQRHMATCSLFAEVLTLLNSASVSTALSLQESLRSWVERRARAPLVLPLLTAACHSLASVRHMAHTTEACILAYFTDGVSLDQSSGWGPILVSLQVPELTAEAFLQESLSLGSFLTLYVYILQRLNLEQTLACERRSLVLLGVWTEQVFPSSASDESKLFLWWHKSLELVMVQVEQEHLEPLVQTLMAMQTRLGHLGEERLASGILGAIGLGKKSPLSSRFRVVARSMSAFLLVQVPAENRLRLQPGTDLQLSPKAQQALSVLDSMPSSKQYSEFQEPLAQARQFISYPGHCLQDGNRLLALLINSLYPEVHYLDIIR